MICIIAGNSQMAWVWARAHMLDKEEWFFPKSMQDLYSKTNFHVLVADGSHERADFEMLFRIARERGKINRI
jgi:hypothetical protein